MLMEVIPPLSVIANTKNISIWQTLKFLHIYAYICASFYKCWKVYFKFKNLKIKNKKDLVAISQLEYLLIWDEDFSF